VSASLGTPDRLKPKDRYLTEVQGLRTIASLMVASYHIWFRRVSGGVDVFFVVAAYFMTLSLLKLGSAGSAKGAVGGALGFFAKTLRRVVPSMVVVLVATIIAALAFMPRVMWSSQLRHAVASSAFLENWWLARAATDYLAQGLAKSPFQQFWALALQMQFYVLWPIAALVCLAIARRVKRDFRTVLTVGFAVLFVGSFAFSLYYTAQNQSVAYYITPTRAWEFAAGALLALLVTKQSWSRAGWRIAGWVALGVLVSFAAALDVSTLFPGVAALVPVLAAALLIAATYNHAGPAVLRWRPIVALAPFSFAFYLWHWPILVFVQYAQGRSDIGAVEGLAIVIAAWALAWGTTRFAEQPFRSSPRLARSVWATVVGCAIAFVPVGAVGTTWFYLEKKAVDQATTALADYLHSGEANGLVPATIIARDDLPLGYANGCHQNQYSAELLKCVYGDATASTTVALVGGSHSLQWLPALDAIGQESGYQILVYTKSSCLFGDSTVDEDATPSCVQWQKDLLAEVISIHPDLVVTLATRGSGAAEEVPEGYSAYFTALENTGISVLAIRDNPWWPTDPTMCADAGLLDATKCSIARDSVLDPDFAWDATAHPNVTFADPTPQLCNDETCPAVDGQILIYRDSHHLTRTWVLSQSDWLEPFVETGLGTAQ
jgi:peptidoglycan/LPS O-acetylase OafA/YrhL